MRQKSPARLDDVSVEAFADYKVITPKHNLKSHARRVSEAEVGPDGIDWAAIERAQAALAELSVEFDGWMRHEVDRLAAAHDKAVVAPHDAAARATLMLAAHDIKGGAETYGYPLAGVAADSLCRLIEAISPAETLSAPLVSSHVDAIAAIVREGVHAADHPVGSRLCEALRAAATDFLLAREGAPSIAP